MAARLTAYVVVGIVAATLIAGLIVGAQRDDSDGPIDLIVHNAKVYTADDRGRTADAVAIRGNQVLRVGSEREITRLRKPQTIVIDAKGGAVLPGFNDAHLQFLGGGLGLDRVSLNDAATVEETQDRIRTWAGANADEAWIVGRGWNYQSFPAGQPTRQQLDAAVSDRPAQLISHDGQASWVNTRALRLAGINRKTPNPPDGVIVRDARTGEATGVLKGSAMLLVSRRLPHATHDDRARALRAAIAEAHRYGVTSVQDTGGNVDDLTLLEEARRAGDLSIRVYAAIAVRNVVNESGIAELDALRARYPDDPLLKAGAVVLTLDGGVESHAAAMLEPYANESTTTGTPLFDRDDFNRMVRLLDARGWQVLTRATGDRAVRMALDAYEHAVRSNPVPERGRRHRVERVEIADAADLVRFGALGVVASMQPYLGSPSPIRIDSWLRSVGPERASRGWAYGSISTRGGRLAFGSDWPVASLNPMLGIHTAVTRTTPDNLPEGGWYPPERVALKPAIDAYTSGAAWASFDEQRKGTLAAGMLADLVVLSDDIFGGPAASLASARVSVTIFDGKVVYQRDGRATN